MKLYEVPRNTKILLEGRTLLFCHIDGMYSYCLDEQGKAVHIGASTEVEIVKEVDG